MFSDLTKMRIPYIMQEFYTYVVFLLKNVM